MENALYNELRMRGQQVGVGIVPAFGKSKNGLILKKRLEGDSFAKIIVAKDLAIPPCDDNGVLILSVCDFLLEDDWMR